MDQPGSSWRSITVLGVAIAMALAVVAVAAWLVATPPAAVPAVAAADRSLVVLPFVDESERKDQEYIAEGLSEELIDRFSRDRMLRVIARTSAFHFKGTKATLGEIATTLHVANVLEGSVLRSGDSLRVNARLIRAADGQKLWSRTFEGSFGDVFRTQDEITSFVTRRLTGAHEAARRAAMATAQPEAYNALLEGRYYFRRGEPGDVERALDLYRKALRIDPQYAIAWARIAQVHRYQGLFAGAGRAAARKAALDAIAQALSIDPQLALAHRIRGDVLRTYDWDWPGARRDFETALALDPDGEDAEDARYNVIGLEAARTGDVAPLIAANVRALERDPVDPYSLFSLGYYQLVSGHSADALRTIRLASELDPKANFIEGTYGMALLYDGRLPEALVAIEAEPEEYFRLQSLAIVHWALGDHAKSDEALGRLRDTRGRNDPYNIAVVYGYRKDAPHVLDWLERAYRQRDPGMTSLLIDPYFHFLRQDPRFRALVVRMQYDPGPP